MTVTVMGAASSRDGQLNVHQRSGTKSVSARGQDRRRQGGSVMTPSEEPGSPASQGDDVSAG